MDEIPAGPKADRRISPSPSSIPFFFGIRGELFKTELIFGGHYACTPDQHVSPASPRRMMERPNLPLSPASHKATASERAEKEVQHTPATEARGRERADKYTKRTHGGCLLCSGCGSGGWSLERCREAPTHRLQVCQRTPN